MIIKSMLPITSSRAILKANFYLNVLRIRNYRHTLDLTSNSPANSVMRLTAKSFCSGALQLGKDGVRFESGAWPVVTVEGSVGSFLFKPPPHAPKP